MRCHFCISHHPPFHLVVHVCVWCTHTALGHPDMYQVQSEGTQLLPHCSWSNSCTWDSTTQNECAMALCAKAGFTSGTYISASNNMCTNSFTSSSYWYYNVESNAYSHGSPDKEAQIVASCWVVGFRGTLCIRMVTGSPGRIEVIIDVDQSEPLTFSGFFDNVINMS